MSTRNIFNQSFMLFSILATLTGTAQAGKTGWELKEADKVELAKMEACLQKKKNGHAEAGHVPTIPVTPAEPAQAGQQGQTDNQGQSQAQAQADADGNYIEAGTSSPPSRAIERTIPSASRARPTEQHERVQGQGGGVEGEALDRMACYIGVVQESGKSLEEHDPIFMQIQKTSKEIKACIEDGMDKKYPEKNTPEAYKPATLGFEKYSSCYYKQSSSPGFFAFNFSTLLKLMETDENLTEQDIRDMKKLARDLVQPDRQPMSPAGSSILYDTYFVEPAARGTAKMVRVFELSREFNLLLNKAVAKNEMQNPEILKRLQELSQDIEDGLK